MLRKTLDPYQLFLLLARLTVGFGDSGEYEKALLYGQEALELARSASLVREEAIALDNLGNAHRYRGELDPALQDIEEALRIFARLPADDPKVTPHRATALNNLGLCHMALAQPGLAASEFAAAIAAYDSLGPARSAKASICRSTMPGVPSRRVNGTTGGPAPPSSSPT